MSGNEIRFEVAAYDRVVIRKIVTRVRKLMRQQGFRDQAAIDVQMDLAATHANGCPLRLTDMLAGDDFSLMHDVLGIGRNLNRETGKLDNMFRPRFSAPKVPA